MLQTLKLNSKKRKNFAFPKKKSLIGSTSGPEYRLLDLHQRHKTLDSMRQNDAKVKTTTKTFLTDSDRRRPISRSISCAKAKKSSTKVSINNNLRIYRIYLLLATSKALISRVATYYLFIYRCLDTQD